MGRLKLIQLAVGLKRRWLQQKIAAITFLKNNPDIILAKLPVKKRKRTRNEYVNWKFTGWWRMLQNPLIKDETTKDGKRFRRRFRVPYPVFAWLVKQSEEHNFFGIKDLNRKHRIPTELKVLAVLRILGRGNEADTIHEISCIGESTINSIFKTFLSNFVRHFEQHYLRRKPEPNELATIMKVYEKLGFPGAIGTTLP